MCDTGEAAFKPMLILQNGYDASFAGMVVVTAIVVSLLLAVLYLLVLDTDVYCNTTVVQAVITLLKSRLF